MRSFQHRDYFFHPCQACGAVANLTRNTPAAAGGEHRTYECRRCGQIAVYQVAAESGEPWIVIEQTRAQAIDRSGGEPPPEEPQT